MVHFASPPAPTLSAAPFSISAVRERPPQPYGAVDPFDDADALEELGDEIALLAAELHAAESRLLTLVAEFDRRRGWALGGYASCAHWLAGRTGIGLHTAREKVRAANALASLPETSAAMARGELSLCAVRALSRVATPENEAALLEAARGCTVAQIERMVRAVRVGGPDDGAERERRRFEARCLSIFPDPSPSASGAPDGGYVVRGRLTAEAAALVMAALDMASDALWREDRERVPELLTDAERQKAAAQRRADALRLIAERALSVGFGGAGAEGEPDAPLSGSRAERYVVTVHADAEALAAGRGAADAELDDGTRVSHETFSRLSCDCSVVGVTHAPGSRAAPAEPVDAIRSPRERPHVLDVGRKTRTIPPALRRALHVRDRGCRFPSCGMRFADAHHVVHWSDGGETSLGNCLLLCWHHHRLVHEGGWSVAWAGDGRPLFTDPRGGLHYDGRWTAPALPEDPVDKLLADNAVSRPEGRQESRPDAWTAAALWEREADVPWRNIARFYEAAEP